MTGVGGVLATGLYTGTDVSDAFLVAMTLVLLVALVVTAAAYMRHSGGHHPNPQ
jgi:hypothetical protein